MATKLDSDKVFTPMGVTAYRREEVAALEAATILTPGGTGSRKSRVTGTQESGHRIHSGRRGFATKFPTHRRMIFIETRYR